MSLLPALDLSNLTERTGTLVELDRPRGPIPAPSHSLHDLPSRVSDFTGRTREVEQLAAILSPNPSAKREPPLGAAISGQSGRIGIGKTALALQVAHRLSEIFVDAQIYIDLKGSTHAPLSVSDAAARVIHAFDPNADLRQASPNELTALYQGKLNGKRALLVLDNAADAAQIKPLLPPPGCTVLVTSRHSLALHGLKPLCLDVLSDADASHLLDKLCPRIEGEATEIAHLCGGVPLALRIAGGTLAQHPELFPDIYAASLSARRARFATLAPDASPNFETQAALELIYGMLPREAQGRWRSLAVFPFPFDLSAAGAVWALDEQHARALLDYLVQISLVERDETSDRYRLNDLLADMAWARLEKNERAAAQLRYAKHYSTVAAAANALFLKSSEDRLAGLGLFDLEWPHIRTGWEWALENQSLEEALHLLDEYPNAAAHCLAVRQSPLDRIVWLEKAVSAARKLGDRRAACYHLGNLGLPHADLGDMPRAMEYHEHALTLSQEIDDRYAQSVDLGNLGHAHAHSQQTRKSIECFEQALALARALGDKRSEANRLGNLGICHAELGENRQAIQYCEQAHAIFKGLDDKPNQAAILSLLGNACAAQGDTRKGIGHLEESLSLFRQLGDKRGETAILGDLGLAHADLGDAPTAIAYFDQALALSQSLGDRHGAADAFSMLGNAYADLGDARKAILYFERALAVAREMGDERSEGILLGQLGLAHSDLGHTRKAIEYHEAALSAALKTGDRRSEGTGLGNLGNAYADLGNPQKAMGYYERALVIAQELGDRRAEANRLGNLGLAYAQLGDVTEAIQRFEQALPIARETKDKRTEATALYNLAFGCAELGQARRSAELYEQALTLVRELGDKHAQGTNLAGLGNACASLGDSRKAVDYLSQALVIVRELGDQKGEAAVLGNLGNAHAALGDAHKAVELHTQALAIVRSLGDHSGQGAQLSNLGNSYAALGDLTKATKYYGQALGISRTAGDKPAQAAVLGNLGKAHVELGDARKALKYHIHALGIARELDDQRCESANLGGLGSAYASLGDARKASEYWEQALAITREIGDRVSEATYLERLGQASSDLGDTAKAIECYESARALFGELSDKPHESDLLRRLGDLLSDDESQFTKAKALYRQAIRLEPDDPSNYIGIVWLLRKAGHEQEAIPMLEKRAELVPNNLNPPLALASIHKKLGNTQASQKYVEEARAIIPTDDWYDLACLESISGNVDLALAHLRRAAQQDRFDHDWAWQDWDLEWLRGDPHFAEIVGPAPAA